MNIRNALPGEWCVCGRQAVEVFVYESGREVGYCGIADGGKRSGPCPFCGSDRRHVSPWGDPIPCPHYRVRPASVSAGEWLGRCVECGSALRLDAAGWPVGADGSWLCPVNAAGHRLDEYPTPQSPVQRRLCAHAEIDGAGMHWLEPGEKCPGYTLPDGRRSR